MNVNIIKIFFIIMLFISFSYSYTTVQDTFSCKKLKADSLAIIKAKLSIRPDSIYGKISGSTTVKITPYPDSVSKSKYSDSSGQSGNSNTVDGVHKSYIDTVRNGARDSLLALKLGLHGKADSSVISDTVKHLPHYAQIVFVAKSGGDYTTIQAAINSIGDASTSKRYCVYVLPGKYTEQVTLKTGVDLIGVGKHCVQLEYDGDTNGTVILANYTQIQDVLIEAVTDSLKWGIVGTNVHDIHIRDVDLLGPFDGSKKSRAIKITGDSIRTIFVEHCIVNYFGTSGNALYFSGKASAPQNNDMTLNDVFVDALSATTGGCMYYSNMYAGRIRSSLMRTSASGYCISVNRSAGTVDLMLEGTTLEFGSEALEIGSGATVYAKHSTIENYSGSGTLTRWATAVVTPYSLH
jgi:hypothetical protein